MSDFVCKECGKAYDSRRGFHAHLKAHSVSIGEYYVENYAKRDLFTNELLKFKNYDQYFMEDFNQPENYISWLKTFQIAWLLLHMVIILLLVYLKKV